MDTLSAFPNMAQSTGECTGKICCGAFRNNKEGCKINKLVDNRYQKYILFN